jgi:hypothetical protein
MIQNVIDNRKRQHRWERITAVIEPTWHDNSVADADQAEPAAGEAEYEERSGLSAGEAVAWAQGLPYPVTVYVYDETENPSR